MIFQFVENNFKAIYSALQTNLPFQEIGFYLSYFHEYLKLSDYVPFSLFKQGAH